MGYVRRLVWDAWNVGHIARHEVTPDEVEQVCHGNAVTSMTHKGRLRVMGPSHTDRMLTVILAPKGQGLYYVVTARPASREERRRYQELKGSEAE